MTLKPEYAYVSWLAVASEVGRVIHLEWNSVLIFLGWAPYPKNVYKRFVATCSTIDTADVSIIWIPIDFAFVYCCVLVPKH